MTLDDLQSWLLAHEWQSSFGDRTLQRGRDYARRGRVYTLELQASGAHGCELRGSVAGSGGNVYACGIRIDLNERWLLLDTECSCPVGTDCKHAAAMLLSVAGNGVPIPVAAARATAAPDWLARLKALQDMEELSSWDRWLASLDRPSDDVPTADPEHRFGILLRGDGSPYPYQRLLALPAWLRPSKSRSNAGALVDPRPLRLDDRHGAVPAPAEGWPEPVATALAVLLAAPSTFHGNAAWLSLRSAHAEWALEQLLSHYPVWHERGSRPIERGPTLAATLDWIESADGSQRLQMRLDATDAQLLLGASLWYIEPKAARYGRVEGDAQLFQLLSHAPVLKPQHLATVRQRLAASGAGRRLPAPIERGSAQVVRTQPTPTLRLRPERMQFWNGRDGTIGMAALGYDYAGHAVDNREPSPVVTRLDDQGIHEIHRDRAAEQRWQQALRQHGLHPRAELDSGYVPNAGRDPLDDWYARTAARKPPLAPDAWEPLVGRLAAAGFRIEYADDFPHHRLAAIGDWHAELSPSGNAWFDVSLGVDVEGERIDLLPVLRQLIADPAFPFKPPPREKKDAVWLVKLDASRRIELPLTRLRALIEPLLEWLESEPGGAPRVHRSQVAELDAIGLPWRGGEALRAQLQELPPHPPCKPPRGFKAALRPYQLDGLAWLHFLGTTGLGGILADDMGLGKTVQVLAHILGEKQRGRLDQPVLVVAPTSLVGNWQAEAARFAPTLKVLILHGSDRADRYDGVSGHDLIITTYPLLPRDRDKLIEAKFSLLVLDEAQAIKNAASQAAQVVREIPAARRLAMTGTPLENHLGEL